MEINFKGPVMPVDPYSQMAFVEILNILLTARHIVDVNRFLINRNANPLRSSYEHELRGQPWKAYCAICKKYEELAQSKCNEIVARFRQLTGIV